MNASPRIDLKVAGAPANERLALGKAARKRVKRSSHSGWEPATGRPDPVELLQKQAADRVPDLVPLRYGRMLASPFTFFRGAAAIMAADLAETPSSGLWVQACGDAHLSNIGGYASPERDLVVDLNDFDETLPAPWEWDVKRLATSFEIAGRARGFKKGERREIVLAAVASYRETMNRLAGLGNLDVWYQRLNLEQVRAQFAGEIGKKERKRFEHGVTKARRKDRMRAFSKLTRLVEGEPKLASSPPVLVPIDELLPAAEAKLAHERIGDLLGEYRETLDPIHRLLFDSYRYADTARKVVGVGSVGTRAWVVLMVGRDDRDPLFLQVKEAQPSVLEPYAAPTEFPHQGQRVVIGQRLTQASSDIMLGWVSAKGPDGKKRDFYVRQLWDQKGSAAVEEMGTARMAAYARICGTVLARAHARSGDRIAIAAYLGTGDSFDRALAEFATAYAAQNDLDYAELAAAAEDGTVPVEYEPDR